MCERVCTAQSCQGRLVALVKRWLSNNVDALELYALVASLIGKSSATKSKKDPLEYLQYLTFVTSALGHSHWIGRR